MKRKKVKQVKEERKKMAIPKICSTPLEFQASVNDMLVDFLKEDFKDYVFETEKEMIDKEVYIYQSSEESMKKRRKENGGLSDIKNMEAIVLKANSNESQVVYVNNTQPQEEGYLAYDITEAEAVEIGSADWNMSKTETNKGPGPREFTRDTFNEIKSSNQTYLVFANYFGKKGIKTKKI